MTDTIAKLAPRSTADTEEFWTFAAQGQLMLRHCKSCGNRMYYPRILCTQCMSTDLDWVEASGRAIVHAFTLIHRAPTPAFRGDVPYPLAIVELEEGPRMMSNIVDCDNEAIIIGMRLELTFEPRGGAALPQFRPADAAKGEIQ
jgi:uncharacterized OB-fold protein